MSRPPPARRIHAVILAGGLGARLGGVRKADLIIGGQRLLERVSARFSRISGQLLIATGRHQLQNLPPGAVALPDAHDHSLGPMAGLAAAAQHLRQVAAETDLLVSVAVDSPFLPEDYVDRLVASDGPAAYAGFGEAFYPTNAVWRLKPLWAALAKSPNNAGPKLLLREMGARQIEWTGIEAANPFANVNSLADLLALQRRALAETGSDAKREKPGKAPV